MPQTPPPGVDLEGGPAWGRVFYPVSQPAFTGGVQKGAFSKPGSSWSRPFLTLPLPSVRTSLPLWSGEEWGETTHSLVFKGISCPRCEPPNLYPVVVLPHLGRQDGSYLSGPSPGDSWGFGVAFKAGAWQIRVREGGAQDSGL